jgi:hypothetical protein
VKAINTSCYVSNWVFLKLILLKTPYELWFEHKPNISCFYVFGSKCFILNNKDILGKFDGKPDEGIFLGYFSISKAYIEYITIEP